MECVIENKAKNWIPASREDSFSNQLIDAYLNGKKDGMEYYKILETNKFNENIKKTGFIIAELVNTLKLSRFNPIDAYLRVNSLDKFEIMITIPEEDG